MGVLPGAEVLDRELVFDEGGRADLAAVDAAGRLHLVLVADDLDRTPLDVLDTLSFARRHRALLGRHLGRRVAPELDPRVFVVTPADDERLTVRLAPLLGAGVELFAVRTIASRAGERSYLVPLAAPGPGAEAVPGGEDVFLEALPPALREQGETVVRRVSRLDDELEASATRDALSWRFRGEVLVRVEHVGAELVASVSPHEERRSLDRERALDDLLEEALGRLVELLGRSVEAGAEGGPEGDPATGEVPPSPRELLSEEGPLLTAEELEAFRE